MLFQFKVYYKVELKYKGNKMKNKLLTILLMLLSSISVVAGDHDVANNFYFKHSNSFKIFGGFYNSDNGKLIITEKNNKNNLPKSNTDDGLVIIVPKEGFSDVEPKSNVDGVKKNQH